MQERFVAGSLAGATAQTIIYPMEVRRRDPGRGPSAGWEACNDHGTLWCDRPWHHNCLSLIQTVAHESDAVSCVECVGIGI